LSSKQLLCVIVYSLFFPIAQLFGSSGLSVIFTFPFLGGAYLLGMFTASMFGSENYYLIGATLAIFLQATLVVWLINKFKKRRGQNAT
jgi:hypothetical protein